jgi:hypothetical protein
MTSPDDDLASTPDPAPVRRRLPFPADGRSPAGANAPDKGRGNPAHAGRRARAHAKAGGVLAHLASLREDHRARSRAGSTLLAGLAVVIVLGASALVTWTITDDTPAPARPPLTAAARPPASASPSPSASARRSRAPSAAPSTPLPFGAPGDTHEEQDFLSSDGSVTGRGRSVITLKSSGPLTMLNLVVRLAVTPELVASGGSCDPAMIATVTPRGNVVEIRFALAAGTTLPAGTYKCTAEYDHRAGQRNAGGDTYVATATSAGTTVQVYGNFFPRSS